MGIFFTIKIISKSKSSSGNLNSGDPGDIEEKPLPTLIVPSTLTTDKLTPVQFSYSVSNLGNYTTRVYVSNDVASINSSLLVTPKSAGTAKIYVEINCSPAIVKSTVLVVKDAVTDVDYKILDAQNKEVSTLYVGNSYNLQITENAVLSDVSNLGFESDYVTTPVFVSKVDNVLLYSFTVTKFGNFSFEYKSKHCTKVLPVTAYVYPEDFSIEFSHSVDEIIKLYLFNKNYVTEANADGYFDSIEYKITTTPNSNDSVLIDNSNSDIIVISNGAITARGAGTSTINFTSQISGESKTITVEVRKVEINKVVFNNNESAVGGVVDLELEKDKPFEFNFEILPKYAIGEITYSASSGLKLENGTITLNDEATQKLDILFNGTIVFTVNVSLKPTYSINFSLEDCTGEFIVSGDTIYVSENCYFQIYCEIATNNVASNSIDVFKGQVDDDCVLSVNGSESVNGYLTFKTLQAGTTQIIITNEEYNASKTITIVVR